MKLITYWATTALVALVLLSGGTAQLLHQPDSIDGLMRLGYPAYIASILGAWKLIGGLALLVPRLPRIKEWAYAGTIFDLTGAAASHAISRDYGDHAFHLFVPLIFAGLAVVSWMLRPPPRRLAGPAV